MSRITDASYVQLIPPDPQILAIARLYLEKYDALAEEDRKLYRGVVAALMNPLTVVDSNKIDPKEFERLTGR